MPRARIRTLKPEIWLSPEIMNISREGRLLFIGLITQADDEGRGITEPRKLKATIYPGDDITTDRLGDLLKELEGQGLITTYDGGRHGRLYQVVTFRKHQSIDRAKPSAYPPQFDDTSTTDRRTIDDTSTNSLRRVPEPSATHRGGSDPIRSDPNLKDPIRSEEKPGASPSPGFANAAPAPRPAALKQLLDQMNRERSAKGDNSQEHKPVLREMKTAEPKAQPKPTAKEREEADIRADAARLQAMRRRAGLP